MVGTPGSEVARVRATAASVCAASKRGSMTISPPRSTVRFNTQVLANTWNSGNTPMIRSSASGSGSITFTCRALADRFWWVSIAPLGVPVVPPVYWISATSPTGSISAGVKAPSLAISAEKAVMRGSSGRFATSARLNRR